MKSFALLVTCLLTAGSLFAQLDIPQRSPKASTSLRVGLTDVTVEYSSPTVSKRAIWGYLVPFDKVWRAGANQATNVVFGTDVTIGDAKVSRGRYALFLIPKNGTTWTAIINSDFSQWGAYKYDESKDMARVDVKVDQLVKNTEHLTYSIEEQGLETGAIVLEWERKRVTIPFKMETMKMALANIDKAMSTAKEEDKWWMQADAAEFLLLNDGDIEKAATMSEESVKAKAQVWNTWIHAKILAKKGDTKGALAAADKAKEISATNAEEKDSYQSLEKEITTQVAIWKRKK
jgi:hypothetical protein